MMRRGSSILDYAAKPLRKVIGERNIWGFADQLLISFTNFATMILVARGLKDTAAFGTFALIYSALLLANVIQYAMVTQPHNVLGATRIGEAYGLYTTATALVQCTLAVLLGLIATAVAFGAAAEHAPYASQLIALIPSIMTWQLQEFGRKVLYTEGRFGGAFANDLISYGGQTVLIAILWVMHRLTGAAALWSLAITSGVASCVGFFQIHRSLRPAISWSAVRENWQFGKWLLGSELLQWCSSLQMYLYLAAYMLGTSASGTLRAAQILFGPARVISFFLQSILPIRFTRALAAEGESALGAQMRKAAVLVLCTLGPYCLILSLFPKFVLSKVFDPTYAEHPQVLSLYSMQAMMSYLAIVLTSALAARRMTREIFLASVCSSAVALVLSWPMIKWLGIVGVIACMMLATLAMTSFLYYRYRNRRALDESHAGGFPVVLASEEQACPN